MSLSEVVPQTATSRSNAARPDLARAAGIVAAYVSNNSLRPADLPDLIAAVHTSLSRVVLGAPAPATPTAPAVPAVPIKKSISHDYVVCLEDGKRFKSLRRHLAAHHGLTPEQYRVKWGLAADHPIVAPAYSDTRSNLAKAAGLGVGARKAEPAAQKPAGKRGRPKKAG